MKIYKSDSLRGEITVPGDKSISHRAVLLGAIAEGTTLIHGFLKGEDCLSTISCFEKMGVKTEIKGTDVTVYGRGINGLCAPKETLYTGNSGTTTRLLCGLLAGQDFECVLDGDASIRKRPMKRVAYPLSLMGADITCENEGFCPIHIKPAKLNGIEYTLPVASAQLKSALLLAGLYANGKTVITEPEKSRNHTETMLKMFGCAPEVCGKTITVTGEARLYATEINVPGDISSAAFFMVAGLICKNSEILIKNVGINETRTGILDILVKMGGNITLLNKKENGGEPVCDMLIKSSPLYGTEIGGEIIPALIDEIPVLAVAAAFAEGTTVIKDAAELKVKESDRIKTVCNMLETAGAKVTPTDDGMIIEGGAPLHGGVFEPHGDHRLAMASAVLAKAAGESEITGAECADISYPGFYEQLDRLSGDIL